MNFFDALNLLVPGTNIKRSGWTNKLVYIDMEFSNFYDKIIKLQVLENECSCGNYISNEDMISLDWITSNYSLTSFSNVIVNLKLGMKARRLLAPTNAYLVIINNNLVSYSMNTETYTNISLNSDDILTEDWIIF